MEIPKMMVQGPKFGKNLRMGSCRGSRKIPLRTYLNPQLHFLYPFRAFQPGKYALIALPLSNRQINRVPEPRTQ